jgi:hypothetical protein
MQLKRITLVHFAYHYLYVEQMVFLDMIQCSLVDRNQHSERTCCHPYSWSEKEAESSPKCTYTTLHGIISKENVIYAYIYSLPSEPQITCIMVHFAKSAHVMRRLQSFVSTSIPTFPICRYSSHSDHVLQLHLKLWNKFNFGGISSLSSLLYMKKANSKFYYFSTKL